MRNLHEHFSPKKTPQSEPIPGRESEMKKNAAGGYTFTLDKWATLDRFLILGTEGGTYYTGERELTRENAQNTLACIAEDGIRVVDTIVGVSQRGLAAKNDYALFALALTLTFAPGRAKWPKGKDSQEVEMLKRGREEEEATRRAAYDALPLVARTGTHLFIFLNYIEGLRGWSRGLRRAVSRWYQGRSPERLAYQLIKYRQRYGFSHRDALRLAHPKSDGVYDALFEYVTKGWSEGIGNTLYDTEVGALLAATETVQKTRDHEMVASLIEEYDLPREVIPTWMLGGDRPEVYKRIWNALLFGGTDEVRMPLTALIRNLGNLTKQDILRPMTATTQMVATTITNPRNLRKAKVHPFAVLAALMTYRSGQGYRGGGAWSPVGSIVEALERAFYLSFENVEPTGKRIIYGIDVSGSMTGGYWGTLKSVAGVPGLTPAKAAGAIALVCAATEPTHEIWGFDNYHYDLKIHGRSSLQEAFEKANRMGGATDASLPFRVALERGIEADAFVLLTDNETWYGPQHPYQALAEYRMKSGLDAKLVVMAMTATDSTIGDVGDPGVLDVVGMSTDTPRLISNFIR